MIRYRSSDSAPTGGPAKAGRPDRPRRNADVPAKNTKELSNVSGYRTFRQVADAGSFEGQTTYGLGVRARLLFRVFTVAGPGTNTRLVVDVVHHW